jgi:hypothetical protein
MKAENVTTSQFRRTPDELVEIRVAMRFELLNDEEGNVSTKLSYEPFLFADNWLAQDVLHQKLFNGIHSGLASVKRPLPARCLGFDISQLHVSPPLEEMNDAEVERISNVLLEIVSGMVATLWGGSEALRDG